jgi:hypothetical protein
MVLAVAAPGRARGATIHVPSEEPTIQAGIDAAAAGDTILVAPGIYAGPGNRAIEFSGMDVVLVSETGALDTVIDCGGQARGFQLHGGETPAAIIEGFTIRDGVAGTLPRGGGMLCDGSSPTVRACVFESNHAQYGGGVCCLSASPVFVDCEFVANTVETAGGGLRSDDASVPTLMRCRFDGNQSFDYAGGLACYDAQVDSCVFVDNWSYECAGAYAVSAAFEACTFVDNIGSFAGGGLGCAGATVIGCMFDGNAANAGGDPDGGGGLYVYGGSPLIDRCTFWRNYGMSGAGGLGIGGSASATVTSCTFYDNQAPLGASGIMLYGSASAEVHNTIIAYGDGSEAVECGGTNTIELFCCDVYGNQGGNWVGCIAGQANINDNFSEYPDFCDAYPEQFTLHETSPCAPANSPGECGLVGAWPVGCPRTYVVRPDGSGDFPTIFAAVQASRWEDTILLASGIFTGGGNTNIPLNTGVTIRSQSGDPDSCVVDCQGSPRQPSIAFSMYDGDPPAHIEGFTIRNGYSLEDGGAIWLHSETVLTIHNCIFENNQADLGGAISCWHLSHPNVTNSVFRGNRARIGGVLYCNTSSPDFRSCTLYDNAATEDGSAIYSAGGWGWGPTLCQCIIVFGEGAAAIGCDPDSEPYLQCCDVFGNEGGDFVGCIEGYEGIHGNFSAGPFFCAPEQGDLHLAAFSPCAPGQNPECGLVGALSVACSGPIAVGWREVPTPTFGLRSNVPNPFNPSTTIRYDLAVASPVSIEIWSVDGRLVRVLLDEPQVEAGRHQVTWDGRDAHGRRVASGIYFYRLQAGDRHDIARMVLLK